VGIFDRGIILDCHHVYFSFFTPYIKGVVMSSELYEARIIDDLRGDLSVAQCIVSEYEDRTQEFKKAVQGIYIDVFNQDEFARRVDVQFREIFKDLIEEQKK